MPPETGGMATVFNMKLTGVSHYGCSEEIEHELQVRIFMKRFFALVGVLMVSACMQMTPIVESKPVNLTSKQISDIKSKVTYDFFDPSGAQFRNIRAVDVTLQNGAQERRVCGEVNGKNRMGGYVGFQMFGGIMQGGAFQKQDFFSACEAW